MPETLSIPLIIRPFVFRGTAGKALIFFCG